VSSIEWTEETLNAWTGCRKVSAGCANCYITRQPPLRIARRTWVKGVTLAPDGSGPVVYHLERIDKMVRRRKPTVYFVNSMSDVFLEDVPDEVIALLFAGMACAPQHTFQVLTKRPERMHALLTSDRWNGLLLEAFCEHGGDWPRVLAAGEPDAGPVVLPNVWLGVTVENRAQVKRADLLRATPAAIRFLSCEPLIGPVVPSFFSAQGRASGVTYSGYEWPDGKSLDDKPGLDLSGIDWVIAGGESGPDPRPCREEWLRDLRDACQVENRRRSAMYGAGPQVGELDQYPPPPRRVKFFLKQLGGHPDKRGGDKALLDGELHHRMPPLRPAQASLLA
jgi:protein gp37